MGDSWKATAELYTGFIDKPKMAEKLLLKPPFKYLFDIITATTQKTGFANGLYVGDQLKPDYYGQKDRKISYLNKIITLVSMMDGSKVQADPKKIVAGLQPELTNQMLQAIHRCATSGKSSDTYVKKVLGGGSDEPQVKQQKKKIDRPPSAAKTKKDGKKPVEKVEEPKEEEAPIEPVIERPKQKQQYSKKVEELRKEGQEQEEAEKQTQAETEKNKKELNMGRLGGKKKKNAEDKEKGLINTTGQLTEKELDLVKSMIQSICQNTAPLGKSIQFINDDIESMNKELAFWRKQYNSSKAKMQNEQKITEQALLPIYDKLGEIEEQIKDQKGKIQTGKAQILKNDSTIRDLLLSVVTTK